MLYCTYTRTVMNRTPDFSSNSQTIVTFVLFHALCLYHERSKLQNPNKMEVGFTAHFRNLLSSGQYQFKGYLGRMPINANGRYNITFSKVQLKTYYSCKVSRSRQYTFERIAWKLPSFFDTGAYVPIWKR